MTENSSHDWTEGEYLAYLAHERHMYSWCLTTYGKLSLADAQTEALAHYPSESASDELRGPTFQSINLPRCARERKSSVS
jgi:hypothetical protein